MSANFKLIGARVKSYRRRLHITREGLAESANLSVRFIGNIETGRKRASIDTMIGIADALGITVDLLLLGNCDSEIIGHVCEFAELIIGRDDDERDAILDAAVAIAETLRNSHKNQIIPYK